MCGRRESGRPLTFYPDEPLFRPSSSFSGWGWVPEVDFSPVVTGLPVLVSGLDPRLNPVSNSGTIQTLRSRG